MTAVNAGAHGQDREGGEGGSTVPPGYKGFTTTQVLSAETQASYYVTRGIKLIEVTGIDMSFPGYQDNLTSGDSRVIYNTIATPINPLVPIDPRIPLDNYQSIAPCNSVSDSPSNALGGVRPKAAARSFKLTVCPPSGRCVTHSLRQLPPPKIRRATAILTRGGRTYATGTDIRGRIRLNERRKIGPGRFRLTIKQKPRKFIVRQNGRRLHTAEQHVVINVPVNLCGNTVGPPRGITQPETFARTRSRRARGPPPASSDWLWFLARRPASRRAVGRTRRLRC